MRAIHRGLWALAALILGAAAAQADQINWQTDLETAKALAARDNRLVLVHFWAPWCSPCMRLEQNVFKQSGVGPSLESHYVPVKVNLDQAPKLAELYGVKLIPCDVVLSPQGQLLRKTISKQDAHDYVKQLDQIAAAARATPGLYANNSAVVQASELEATTPFCAVPGDSRQNQVTPAGLTDDRYADFFNGRQGGGAAGQSQPTNEFAGSGAAHQGGGWERDSNNPYGPTAGRGAAQGGFVSQPIEQRASQVAANVETSGTPPLGLEGYCPVSLCESQKWKKGDARYGVIHRGRTYLFAGAAEQQQFWANPDRYSPVAGGQDPVIALDHQQTAEGSRKYGVFYEGRIYLFAGDESLARFWQAPTRYAAPILQAMRQQR